MAQLRQRNPKNGVTYVYEADAVWDKVKKQSRYVNRRMIGHVDPDTGEVVPNRAMTPRVDAPTSTRLFTGATHLLGELAGQTGLTRDLAVVLGSRAAAVEAFAQFLVTEDPAPASRFSLWARTHAHPLGEQTLSSQRWSEVFASISQTEVEEFFTERVERASGTYWFFDTTSISSYSQFLERVRWGRNKDRVPLPQVNLAVVKDAATGLPLAFKDLPGNISDVSLVESLVADFTRLGATGMKLCMDRGFYSKDNINALMGAHMKFLICVKTSLTYVKHAISEHGHTLRGWEHYNPDLDVYAIRVDHPWAYHRDRPRANAEDSMKRSYLHLYYNPKRAVDDERDLSQLLARLHRELTSGKTIDEHQKLYDRYFRKARGTWTGIDDAIEQTRSMHGYYALLSNDASLNCWQAHDVYRSKDEIEKAFMDIKDRLDLRTTRMHNHETLTGKLFTVFTALILTSELHRRIKSSKLSKTHTMRNILDELETIEQYTQPGHRPRILHTTQKQQEIYTALGVEPPTTS